MTSFKHISPPLDIVDLKVETLSHGRFYVSPEGDRYPSVTTILSAASDKTWKEEWIARVGQEEADRVSKQATTRGTAVHKLLEDYLDGKEDWQRGHMPANIISARQLIPLLHKNVSLVYAQEIPLWSKKLRAAGRCDLAAKWNGKDSIIDFKTSKRPKFREDITDYFLQKSAYAYMMYERTGMVFTKLVTLITVDTGPAQVFVEDTKVWLPKFIELRESVNI